MIPDGVWVPVVTPFRDGEVDVESLGALVEGLIPKGVSALVAAATTGEALALSEEEHLEVARCVRAAARGRVPVFAGAGSADTRRAITLARKLEDAGVDGILSVAPYYVRPEQRGLLAHFEAIAASTRLPVVLYNIPGRTAVNLENGTIRRLAAIDNVVGLKDCAGDLRQSAELLLDPPPGFSIFTGEDALFLPMLALGARGGILASAHWATESFVEVWRAMRDGDAASAREIWRRLFPATQLFFAEPNPAPIKHLLHAGGAIASGEVRLPLATPSDGLRGRLEAMSAAAPTEPPISHGAQAVRLPDS